MPKDSKHTCSRPSDCNRLFCRRPHLHAARLRDAGVCNAPLLLLLLLLSQKLLLLLKVLRLLLCQVGCSCLLVWLTSYHLSSRSGLC